ncbi:MAG: glycosyltransferase family 4 protein [Acidimicrobiales bacterium]
MCKALAVPRHGHRSDAARLSVALDATPLLGRPTGVGAFVAGLIDGLARRQDVDVSAFAVSWRRRHGIDSVVPPEVDRAQRPMPARPLHASWRRLSWPPADWFVGRHDVVHGTNFVVPPAHAARVVSVHDLTPLRYPHLCDRSTLVFPDLVRRAIAAGAYVHTLSDFVADEVVDAFGAAPDHVRTVHLGVPLVAELTELTELTELSELSELAGGTGHTGGTDLGGGAGGTGIGHGPPVVPQLPVDLPRGTERYVIAIGTVEPRKDYPSLVAAFTRVAASDPGLALVIVGASGWGADAVEEAVGRSPAAARVVRVGYVADVALARLLAGAAALAYPSLYEGFGFPPLQAMAAGVPVVTTRAGAIPEVVGDAAVLVPPGDADALADALADVLAGGPEVDALVARGRERSRRFTWDACAEGMVELYRDAAA